MVKMMSLEVLVKSANHMDQFRVLMMYWRFRHLLSSPQIVSAFALPPRFVSLAIWLTQGQLFFAAA